MDEAGEGEVEHEDKEEEEYVEDDDDADEFLRYGAAVFAA